MNTILAVIFPSLELIVSNYKVNKKIKSNELKKLRESYFTDLVPFSDINIKNLRELYEKDFIRKEKLEDKAKINIVAVTISVTLVMGSYLLIDYIVKKYASPGIHLIATIFFSVAVIYMVFSGIHATRMIMDKNIVYCVTQGLVDEEEIKRDLTEQICKNRAMNNIRSNYIYSSYACVRNALICLFVVMIVAIFPIKTFGVNTDKQDCLLHGRKFMYTQESIQLVEGEKFGTYIEKIINEKIDSGFDASVPTSIIDDKEKLFIKFSYDGNVVNVYLVERYVE